jgi:hypothetical protein
MSLQTELTKIREHYSSELSLIFDFVKTTEEKLTTKQSVYHVDNISKNQKDELITFLKSVLNSDEEYVKVNFEEHPIGHILKAVHISRKHKQFLTNMTLGYLISFQEALLKDYLYQILIHNKNSLKSNSKTTFDAILQFDSMEQLVKYLAKIEADSIGYGSIEDVAKYYESKFNIKLKYFANWKLIVEATYRRNLLIHNKNITNEIYCKLTGFDTVGVELENDIDYIQKVTESLLMFNIFCFESISSKFKQ